MMELKKVDRGNLEAMLSLEVDKGQESFDGEVPLAVPNAAESKFVG